MQEVILAGWNMPGYLPESEPGEFDSFEQARAYIVGELDNVIEALYTGVLGDSAASEEERESAQAEEQALKDAIEYVHKQPGEFGFTVGQFHYWATRK